jgi:hypothetical protein
MKVRHAAALTLVGWYLMLPPTDGTGRFRLNLDAPIARWEIDTGFDTARECEQQKILDSNDYVHLYSEPKLKHLTEVLEGKLPAESNAEFGVAQAFQRKAFEKCVASDDPRLNEK